MPTYITIPETNASESVVDTFAGYNHNLKIDDGEFYDMENLTSDYYPLMGNRDPRSLIAVGEFTDIYGMIADADSNLYLVANRKGVDKTALYKIYRAAGKYSSIVRIILTSNKVVDTSATFQSNTKQMMFFSNRLVIYPDKYSVRGEISGTDTSSEEEHEFERLDKTIEVTATDAAPIKFTPCDEDGEAISNYTKSNTAPESPKQGNLWLDTSSAETGLVWKKYISGTWAKTADIKSCVVLALGNLEESEIEHKCSIDEGDTIDISFANAVFSDGGTATVFEGKHTPFKRVIHKTNETINSGIKRYDVELIYVFNDIVTGDFKQTAGSIKLYREAPDLDYIAQVQNRIWGCRYSYTGYGDAENVNEIYACKIGDETRWSTYKGISTDSYRASIGTPGKFTGVATIGGNIVFFKENCYHKVYVSGSGAHQIIDKTVQGVQSGCGGSVTVINDICYYKSRGGVMAFDGAQAYDIGAPLGDVYYVAAEGGSANSKYYLSLKDVAGQWSIFVYDTKKGLWHKEDDRHALAFFSVNNETFFVTEDADGCSINLISDYTKTGNEEPEFDWEAVTGLQGYNYTGQKYISRFNLRMMLPKGSQMDVLIEYDSSGRWEQQGHIKGVGTSSFMIPVKPRRCDHFRIKLRGRGMVRLYSLSKLFEGGTDVR